MREPDFFQGLLTRRADQLATSDLAFARRVYAKPLDAYVGRLRQIGFAGCDRVLDAGCGFGQWSLALAELNGQVDACDVSAERVAFLDAVAREAPVNNLQVARESLVALAYADARFDAIFCYGVLFLTPWREALAELIRVLEPGGKLYVNANGFGWYKHLWLTEHNKVPGYEPRRITANALSNTLRYDSGGGAEPGVDILIDPAELQRVLEENGFEDIVRADEGCIGAADLEQARARAFFRGDYSGDLGVYELTARKRSR